jgi:hypothetical protein
MKFYKIVRTHVGAACSRVRFQTALPRERRVRVHYRVQRIKIRNVLERTLAH